MFAQAGDQSVNVRGFAFDNQFDAAIFKVSDVSRQRQSLGKLNGGHAKTDALNAA